MNPEGKSDFITNVDYDGNWITDDNWDNLDNDDIEIPAYVYYSVSETETHYYLYYATYHPRDWVAYSWLEGALIDNNHENDMEFFFLMVQKDGFSLMLKCRRFHLEKWWLMSQ